MFHPPPISTLFPYTTLFRSYFIITDTSARTTALRSSRVDMELRFLPPVDVHAIKQQLGDKIVAAKIQSIGTFRSEEHTSELQSQSNLVCRLLLEKKKQTK